MSILNNIIIIIIVFNGPKNWHFLLIVHDALEKKLVTFVRVKRLMVAHQTPVLKNPRIEI